ncbi:hypothetical protein B0H10DRAFT_1915811 [Mycena sp. CBHHK59/15]|nr:hypothetical protein B0H10DRAFT_1915811 [Mycena sp. CBHHK59/15]
MHISEGEDSKGPSAGPILNFGDIFDIPRLQRAIRAPVLDWRQVKDPRSQSIDDLGCWNIWGTVNSSKVPHWTVAHERLKLDISYTIVPKWVKLVPGNNIDRHVSFWSLAALSYNTTRFENPSPPSRSPKHGVSLPPDKHLLCFDNLYWVGAKWPHEWNEEISPAWRFVGRHIYWTPKIRELANTYVRKALRVPPHEPTPQYITVHARNGGFGERCKVPLEECFTPLSAIAQGVEEVKAELLATKGITVDAVIVTSDEKNRTWWDAVARQGWLRPDHSRTVERHGLWYPMLIDAAIQAASIGFVGTEDSTVSLLAAKRVKAWYDGSTRSVRSVRLHSDDH